MGGLQRCSGLVRCTRDNSSAPTRVSRRPHRDRYRRTTSAETHKIRHPWENIVSTVGGSKLRLASAEDDGLRKSVYFIQKMKQGVVTYTNKQGVVTYTNEGVIEVLTTLWSRRPWHFNWIDWIDWIKGKTVKVFLKIFLWFSDRIRTRFLNFFNTSQYS